MLLRYTPVNSCSLTAKGLVMGNLSQFSDFINSLRLVFVDPGIFRAVQLSLLFLFSVVIGFLFLKLIFKIISTRAKLRQKYTIFEVKPLQTTEQSSYTTQQHFNLIHGLARQRSFWDRIVNNQKSYSFEIVSKKNEGIRYLIRINQDDAELIRRNLLSYLPGIVVSEINDYLTNELSQQPRKVTEFKISNHFAFPLKKQRLLEEHDPIAYITGNMTKLSENDLISFQIVVEPINKGSLKDYNRIHNLIHSDKDLLSNINSTGLQFPFGILLQLLTLPIGLFVFIASGGKEGPLLGFTNESKTKQTNPYQEELKKLVKEKLDQQVFSTSLRLLVVGDNVSEVNRRNRGFISSLASFGNSGYQSLIPAFTIKLSIVNFYKQFIFKNRLLGFLNNSILSTSEIADVYHFPYTSTTKTEDLVKTHSKQLPAPLSLKKETGLDVVFANNSYGGSVTPIGLTQEERRRHMYILGATGTGKSTLLLSMIDQDIKNNKGICVIDPHGDLIEKILPTIPDNRLKEVIYFNPDDIGYPIGINLLELSQGLDPEDAVREKEFITESIISLFHKIYSDKYSGPRMEYILRNTIHTAFTVPNATLFTVYKLLINEPFRKTITANLTDENLKDFWKYEFSKAGDYQKVKMISPITNKIGRFLFSPTAKRILEQEKSTINFDHIMDSGKILLCNLSKGKIGEDNSEVFGIVIMTKIQLAALKRARVDIEERKDFYLYVDEFQNFATSAFAQILSEARKYKLNAILAHQTTSQLEDKSLVNVTLANTGTIICFRTSNPEDERLILPQFNPYVLEGEIGSLPSYNFYIKINAISPEEPFSGETILLTPIRGKRRVSDVIEGSRTRYAIKYETKVEPLVSRTREKSPPPSQDKPKEAGISFA